MTRFRISAALALSVGLCGLPAAYAQSSDEFQRIFLFHNTSATAIYPVIESPQNVVNGNSSNCGSVPGANGTKTDGLLRIIVNKDASTKGIPPGESVSVAIPKSAPGCPGGAFYNASRIYMLAAEVEALEKFVNVNQQTRPYPGWNLPTGCPGCWVGIASSDPVKFPLGSGYSYDMPGQLLEYTIISQNPNTGDKWPDANDTRGRSLIDFDVSYVDWVQEPPYAMALGDGGATQFMGSTFGLPGPLPLPEFNKRLAGFVTATKWSSLAAFTPLHWAANDPGGCQPPFAADGGPKDLGKTRFSCLIPFRDVVPSASILISTASTGSGSNFFQALWDGKYSTFCSAPKGENAQCALLLPNNLNCCPDGANGMLGCCDIKNFQTANTLSKWFPNPEKPLDPNAGTVKYSNPTLDELVARFDYWRDQAVDQCAADGPGILQSPAIDRTGFCKAFKKTVDFVWNDFGKYCPNGHKGPDDRCIVTKIIGYDKTAGYDPNKCTTCTADPTNCPSTCTVEQMSNESVQALQRSVPWIAWGPPDQCGGCPSKDLNQCKAACVFPKEVSPDAKVYQGDKFLHFWAKYESVYNLNPYATFVHSPDGVAAPGAYSFSIDDFYGNFGGFGSTLIIQAGGYSKMPNREPYDPYKQYTAGFGPGWDHVKVCGRTYRLPPGAAKNVGISPPVSFWNDGTQLKECEVFAYPTADETSYVTFLLKEVQYPVTDSLTGVPQQVQGLSGVAAPRGAITPKDPYCLLKSTAPEAVKQVACSANLSRGFLNKDYVGISDAGCTDPNNAICGKPLVSLNVPPPGLASANAISTARR